jgi:adenylate kinase family enzyme
MQRIAIIGRGGAGKSTLARTLGEKLGLPVIHLDTEHWLPGWVEPPDDVWAARVGELVQGERWIMDGNFGGTFEERFAVADTIVFLDFPAWLCAWRVLQRVQQWHGRNRPDLPEGCPERFDFKFLRWIYTYGGRRGEVLARVFRSQAAGRRVVILRSPSEVRRYVAGLPQPRSAPPGLQRIAVLGPPGAGKTTLAMRIGAWLGQLSQELDAVVPRWARAVEERAAVARLADAERWVIDGSYWPSLDVRLARADAVILLDLPFHVSAKRYLGRRADRSARQFLGSLVWVLAYPLSERHRIRRRLSRFAHRAAVYHIRSVAEEEAFRAVLAGED